MKNKVIIVISSIIIVVSIIVCITLVKSKNKTGQGYISNTTKVGTEDTDAPPANYGEDSTEDIEGNTVTIDGEEFTVYINN